MPVFVCIFVLNDVKFLVLQKTGLFQVIFYKNRTIKKLIKKI